MAEEIGAPVECNLTRSEDDTDDITVRLSKGTIDTTAFTAELSIGADKDGAPVATFSGAAPVSPAQPNGLIVIDMNGFAVPIGSYKYNIRITDAGAGDSPARVYFKGSFKVTPRIN